LSILQARYFSDGKAYRFKPLEGSKGGHILDDRGTERFIVPNEPSPHLKLYPMNFGYHRWNRRAVEHCVGMFELGHETASLVVEQQQGAL
jgi:hypothetical protein